MIWISGCHRPHDFIVLGLITVLFLSLIYKTPSHMNSVSSSTSSSSVSVSASLKSSSSSLLYCEESVLSIVSGCWGLVVSGLGVGSWVLSGCWGGCWGLVVSGCWGGSWGLVVVSGCWGGI